MGILSSCCSADDDYDYKGQLSLNEDSYMFQIKDNFPIDGLEQENNKYDEIIENQFMPTKVENKSTFSIDADGASFCTMRKYTDLDWEISKDMVRIEEYLNYFTFDYQDPMGEDNVAINSELGTCPWNKEHKLLRLGIKGKSLKKEEIPLANYVFMVDVSGSMYGEDRIELLKSGLLNMLEYLNPKDRISIVTYAGEVKLALESTPVEKISEIQKVIKSLNTDGCTNGGDALKMAYQQAVNNYIKGGNNRIIMGTDGDFNVGVTSTEELLKIVEEYASKGIYLTVCGFGTGNYNDGMMEKVSNRGNGTYEYIDNENQMMKVFVHERSKFTSVANDSKCQITFDEKYIESYRLIGYENRVLNNEDFTDDKKDAGEIGAGQTITALFEIVTTPEFDNLSENQKIATFDFRYKKSLLEESIPLSLEIMSDDCNKNLSENFTFAAGVACFGLVARDSKFKGQATKQMAKELISKSLTFDPGSYRKEFLQLIDKVKISEKNN